MASISKKLTVTAVVNEETGNMTAFFNDFPGLVVQGNSEEDVTKKLTLLLTSYIKRLESLKNDFEIHTQSLS